jgi:hypothetical protein
MVIGQIRSPVTFTLVFIGFMIALGATIYGVWADGYKQGIKSGFDSGVFAEREYTGTKSIADACYDWARIYDAKKPGNNEHVERSCDGIMHTANSYLLNYGQ